MRFGIVMLNQDGGQKRKFLTFDTTGPDEQYLCAAGRQRGTALWWSTRLVGSGP